MYVFLGKWPDIVLLIHSFLWIESSSSLFVWLGPRLESTIENWTRISSEPKQPEFSRSVSFWSCPYPVEGNPLKCGHANQLFDSRLIHMSLSVMNKIFFLKNNTNLERILSYDACRPLMLEGSDAFSLGRAKGVAVWTTLEVFMNYKTVGLLTHGSMWCCRGSYSHQPRLQASWNSFDETRQVLRFQSWATFAANGCKWIEWLCSKENHS